MPSQKLFHLMSLASCTHHHRCCWWGRGVIQSTGICNYGKLNYFLGKRAADEGRPSRYPTIDFCQAPDMICSSNEYSELKWIAGFFFWTKEVQSYNSDGWYYMTELHKFVNEGMSEMNFIDSISGIVNRGCHNPPCATGEVDGLLDRRTNFQKVLSVLGLPSIRVGNSRPPSTLPPIPSGVDIFPPAISSDEVAVSSLLKSFIDTLTSQRALIERNVLTYQEVDGTMTLSDLYTFDALMESLAYAHEVGYAGKKFYIGPSATDSNINVNNNNADAFENAQTVKESSSTTQPSHMLKYGLVNLAAFLAQSLAESISNNACDEFHLDSIDGKYPLSNACGQFGNNYQEYICAKDEGMECRVRTEMEIKAVGSGKYKGRPPFYCGPRSGEEKGFTGAYDPILDQVVNKIPYANAVNRTDVEGYVELSFFNRMLLLQKRHLNPKSHH